MSDISKLNIENKEYFFKDAAGRARAEEAATEAEEAAKEYTNELFTNVIVPKVNEVDETAKTALNIAQGNTRSEVFETTSAMYTWLADATNKGVLKTGDSLYVKELDVPDWWITEALDAPNADGRYYNIAPLEAEGAGGGGSNVDIIDNLETADSESALSANQGKILNEKIDGKVSKSGDTITGDLTVEGNTTLGDIDTDSKNVFFRKGHKVHEFFANYGTDGFIKFATIDIIGAIIVGGAPLRLTITTRQSIGTLIIWARTDSESDISTINLSLYQAGVDPDIYIVKSGDSTFDLYMSKWTYETVAINNIEWTSYLQNRITITWLDEFVTELPEDAALAQRLHADAITDYEVKSLKTIGGIKSGDDVRCPLERCNDLDENIFSSPVSGAITNNNGMIVDNLVNAKTFFGSANGKFINGASEEWNNVISIRHRNGMSDGNIYGIYIRSLLTSESPMVWNKQYGSWHNERVIVDTYRNIAGSTLNITIETIEFYIFNAYTEGGTSYTCLLVPNVGRSTPHYLVPLYEYEHSHTIEASISGSTFTVTTNANSFTYSLTGFVR